MPADGLVGWWKLLDGSGTVATDSSGNGNNGNFIGTPIWINTGPNGGGLSFAGPPTTQCVDIDRAVVLEPAAVTMSCWIKGPGVQGGANQSVFAKSWNDNQSPPYASYQTAVYFGGDATAAGFVLGGPSHDLSVSGVVANNTVWQNFVGTYDSTASAPQKLFYLNGVQIGSLTLTDPIPYDTTPSGNLYIASASNPFVLQSLYTGSITDCRVYNRTLSAMEVLDIYNASDSQISGNAGIAGATVHYSGPVSGGVVSGGGGDYTITGLPNGTYTITPSLTGYTFAPTSQVVVISGGNNVSGINFVATPISPVIPATTSILRGPHRGSRVTPPYNP